MHFQHFKPENEFMKWAAVEVSGFENVPNDTEPLVLEGGLYAVFDYKGSSNDPSIFQFIYGTYSGKLMLPYTLDLSIFHKISNQDLIDHITRVGKKFY